MRMANEAYQDVNQLIKDLINRDNEHDLNINNFSGSSFNGVADQQPVFWKKLLEFLHDNTDTGYQSPILQQYFHDATGEPPSVFSFINGKADLPISFWNSLYGSINDSTPYYWNESLDALIKQYKNDGGGGDGAYIKWDAEDPTNVISIAHIRQADAGYSFVVDFVLPTTNIDKQTYTEVRGDDAINSVLTNADQLQFTHLFGNDWIRLIMPKYLRKVEVEDLNRNFWVIGQVLSGVCAYLFKDNMMDDLFKGILSELVGLWENVLFLWAGVAMSSQKPEKITDIHVEFMPIPNSDLQTYRKFDDFDNARDMEVIPGTSDTRFEALMRRLYGVIQQYDNCNVVIVPEIREHNYKHNYYSRVSYPGMLVFNRNTGTYYWTAFQYNVYASPHNSHQWSQYNTLEPIGGPYNLYIDLEEDFLAPTTQPADINDFSGHTFVSKIPGIREIDEITYGYHYPFGGQRMDNYAQQIHDGVQNLDDNYYCAVRVQFSALTNYDTETDTITITPSFFTTDPFSGLVSAYGAPEWWYTLDTSALSYSGSSYDSVATFERWSTTVPANRDWVNTTYEPTWEGTANITKGYYLGEMVSCSSKIVQNTDWTISSQTYWGQQLFTATPEEILAILEA